MRHREYVAKDLTAFKIICLLTSRSQLKFTVDEILESRKLGSSLRQLRDSGHIRISCKKEIITVFRA